MMTGLNCEEEPIKFVRSSLDVSSGLPTFLGRSNPAPAASGHSPLHPPATNGVDRLVVISQPPEHPNRISSTRLVVSPSTETLAPRRDDDSAPVRVDVAWLAAGKRKRPPNRPILSHLRCSTIDFGQCRPAPWRSSKSQVMAPGTASWSRSPPDASGNEGSGRPVPADSASSVASPGPERRPPNLSAPEAARRRRQGPRGSRRRTARTGRLGAGVTRPTADPARTSGGTAVRHRNSSADRRHQGAAPARSTGSRRGSGRSERGGSGSRRGPRPGGPRRQPPARGGGRPCGVVCPSAVIFFGRFLLSQFTAVALEGGNGAVGTEAARQIKAKTC